MTKPVAGRLIQLARHALVQNTIALSAAQIGTYLFPLVTVPYLARVLGVAGWGLVAFAQAFGAYLSLFVEYGFALSATREIARHRENDETLAEITAGVLGAKGVLAAGTIAVALVARWCVPIFESHPDLLWAATFWALAQGFSVLWFFQGFEQMKLVAALDFFAKALATAGIFIFVRAPADGWKVLALQALGASVAVIVGSCVIYSRVRFQVPRWASVCSAVRMGWSMFLFRGSVSLYTAGNAFILGLFVSPVWVGYYAGAEKISKAFVSLLNPVSQTIFPRISHLVQSAKAKAAHLARISFIVMGTGGVLMGAAIALLAPLLVRLILGHSYAPAVPVLRILAFLPPLIALSNVFGIQWMLPLGMDRPFNTIIVTAGAINIGLAVALAPAYRALGMAWSVVCAETFVTAGIYIMLRWHRADPLAYSSEPVEKTA